MGKILYQFICVCMVFCLSVLPVGAKLISLNFEEPIDTDPATAKAYATHVRKLIEEKWHDFYIRGIFDISQVQIDVVIKPDGFVRVERRSVFDPNDKFKADDTFRDFMRGFVRQCPPTPDQQPHLVTITAKCRTAGREMPDFKKVIVALATLAAIGAAGYGMYRLAQASNNSAYGYTNPNLVWVNGYATRRGTWVPGYWRTAANGTMYDNFSSLGNINPFTGQPGTVVPRY